MTTSADWNLVEPALDELLALPPELRAQAIDRIAGGDVALRTELESLLSHVGGEDTLLDAPALDAMGSPGPPGSMSAGQIVGSYRLLSLLGRGGMGEVYKAERATEDFQQIVALKLMRIDVVTSIERFGAERRLLAELDHPGIARLLDGGVTADGRPYMVMEYVEGDDLLTHCTAKRAPLEERVRLLLQVCDAVAYAHKHLIVHRDLKPANIIVTADGRTKLLDFGIAKLLQEGEAGGTRTMLLSAAYAAPEQITGGAVTTATDSYALGVTLYQLLCGVLPWPGGTTPLAMAMNRMRDDVLPRPSSRVTNDSAVAGRELRGDLDAIVVKALRTDPSERYGDARALAADLARHLNHEPVRAREGARAYIVRRFIRRNRWPLTAAAALFIALGIGFAGTAWQWTQAQREADRATATKNFLVSMFRAVDPRVAQDKPRTDITAKELIDANAGRIEREFNGQPVLQIELLGLVADIYGYLNDSARFEALQKRRVELARRQYGPLHPIVIQGMLTDAWAAIYAQNYAEAEAQLERIDALLNAAGRNHDLLRAGWWLAKEQALKAEAGTLDARRQALEHAIALYEELSPHGDDYASALANLATLHNLSEDFAGACRLNRQAIAVEQVAADRDDGDLFVMFANLARCEEAQGDFAAAGRQYDQATELERKTFGEKHGLYWMIQARHAFMLHSRGERDAALAMFRDTLGKVTADWQATTDDTLLRMLYAASLCAEGQPREAIPLLEAAERVYAVRPHDESDLRRLRQLLGDAYDRAGRAAEARAELQAALEETLRKDPPASRPALSIRERWGRFLLQHSLPGTADFAAAEASLRGVLTASQGLHPIEVSLAQADLALAELARREVPRALELSATALASLDGVTGQYDIRAVPAVWLVRSATLRAAGDLDGARAWAEKAVDALARYDDPSSTDLLSARAAARAATSTPSAAL